MYCPSCLNNTLYLKSRGVINIIVNGKQMDSGRFLYNFEKEKSVFLADLKEKLEEFFKWYSNFTNTDPITRIEINTLDAACDNGCRTAPGIRYSVFESNLLSLNEIRPILDELGKKHGLEIEIVTSSS